MAKRKIYLKKARGHCINCDLESGEFECIKLEEKHNIRLNACQKDFCVIYKIIKIEEVK